MLKKNLATKIFLSFSGLVLLQAAMLSFVFGKIVVRETETYILDSLSRRSQAEATDLLEKIAAKKSVELADTPLVDEEGRGIGRDFEIPLSVAEIKSLLPPAGSTVSECGKDLICSATFIPPLKAWLFETTPRANAFALIRKLEREISYVVICLLLAALITAYLLTQVFTRGVRKFAKMALMVSEGEYSKIEIPQESELEFKSLSAAFRKMIGDLDEREKNLILSGEKLAHSARLASIGQMGASIAHEVKNPLTAMKGYAQILSREDLKPNQKEAAEIILREAERCNQIINQLLRFSRNDASEKKPYSLKNIVESAVALMKAEAKMRSIGLEVQELQEGNLEGNGQQIQQVVLNLLLNAMQASPPKTTLKIRSAVTAKDVILEIEDQGSGIPESIREKIFDPFFSTKNKAEGTGLGLSVARDIVQSQGGTLTFRSKEGQGTTFVLSLPIAVPTASGSIDAVAQKQG